MIRPPLPRTFFDRDPVQVAGELLGCLLIRSTDGGTSRRGGRSRERHIECGRIVETEAYLSADDSACHASRGKTRKNASMFAPAGTAYVYAIHSRWCFNVVTEKEGTPSAVLIRALEPLEGIAVMEQRRDTNRQIDLARGPGRLCQALAIDRELDGWDLTLGDRLWIASDDTVATNCSLATNRPVATSRSRVLVSPRIGVTSAHDKLLRFYWADCPYVSGTRKANGAGFPLRSFHDNS